MPKILLSHSFLQIHLAFQDLYFRALTLISMSLSHPIKIILTASPSVIFLMKSTTCSLKAGSLQSKYCQPCGKVHIMALHYVLIMMRSKKKSGQAAEDSVVFKITCKQIQQPQRFPSICLNSTSFWNKITPSPKQHLIVWAQPYILLFIDC